MTDVDLDAPASTSREALLKTRGLNLGSGPHYAPGWVNIDVHDPPDGCKKPDLYVSVFDLEATFPEDSFVAAYLGHFLEHLAWSSIPEALRQVRHVVQPGATVMAVGPCILKAIELQTGPALYEAILSNPADLATSAPGCAHEWTPTTELTRLAMERGGLEDVFVVPIVGVTKPQWPNPSTAAWQVAVQGRVP